MTCSLDVSKSILTSHLISEEETFKLDCFCIKPSNQRFITVRSINLLLLIVIVSEMGHWNLLRNANDRP